MPYAQDANQVYAWEEAIQGEEPRLSSGNNQLPQTMPGESSNQRVICKDLDGLLYGLDLSDRQLWVALSIKLENPLEVCQRPPGERYFGHTFGLGRRARLPSARART